MKMRAPFPPAAERRIRREARSATLRERALALRQAGWTYIAIGIALGVSLTRAHQIVKKAARFAAEGAPTMERPSADSNQPAANGPTKTRAFPWYSPPSS